MQTSAHSGALPFSTDPSINDPYQIMKRFLLNGFAALALSFGAVSLASPAFAAATIQQGPTCGECECDDGQECYSTQTGCKCTFPDEG